MADIGRRVWRRLEGEAPAPRGVIGFEEIDVRDSTAAAAEKTFEEATKVGRTLTCAEPVAESIKTYVGTLPSGRRSEIRTRLPVWSKLIVSFALVRIGQHRVQ